MPLPDAKPEPNKANIYEQFSHIQVKDFTRDNLDVVRDPLYLNSESEDVLRRLLLLGQVSNQLSLSGPIPGSMYNGRVEATSSGTQYNILVPNKGEVWQVCGAFSTSASGLSGTVYLEVKLRDQVNGYTAEIISTSTTSGTDVPMTEITQNPIFIDENMALQVEASGTFTTIFFVVPLIRIR